MIPPWLLALGLVVGLLVLIPAYRLRVSDVQPRVIAVYAAVLWRVAPEYILCLAVAYGGVGSVLGRGSSWQDR